MIINTRRFGEIKIDPSKILTFPEGMIGFGGRRRYVVLPFAEGTPFELLQSVDEPNLAFVVINPFLFKPDYRFDAADEDLEAVKAGGAREVVVRVIVTLPPDLAQMTANLQGPVLINEARLLARQIVLMNADYSLTHPILPPAAAPGPK
ncbi:MAG: flagellar assembly protein FliW [Nitrospinae bacterium]|nr:flagellar assembly protein FliW [Nitrospinota bacterium]